MLDKENIPVHYISTVIGTVVGLALGIFISSKIDTPNTIPSGDDVFVPTFNNNNTPGPDDVPWEN